MSPILQAIVGAAIGIVLMLVTFYFCTRADSLSTMIVYVISLIVITGIFTIYYIGDQGFFISYNVAKNIFLIMTIEELLVAICAAVTLVLFSSTGFVYTDKELISFFGITTTLTTLVLIFCGMYPALCQVFT